MKTVIRQVIDIETRYDCLMFCCPGCAEMHGNDGIHMLPINTEHRSSWTWDGNLELPTVSPSILTRGGCSLRPVCEEYSQKQECVHRPVCHSFLKAGIFEFLGDCTHSLANTHVLIPDLPDWVTNE